MRERPVSVMIFGILNIGWAVFNLISMFVGALLLAHAHGMKNPMMDQMTNNPGYAAWVKISTPLGGIVHLALLAAGIGLLLLQNWARIVSICFGIYSILASVVGTVLMVPMFSAISRNPNSPPMVGIFMVIGLALGFVIVVGYASVLIIFMTRPKVVAAFRSESLPPALAT